MLKSKLRLVTIIIATTYILRNVAEVITSVSKAIDDESNHNISWFTVNLSNTGNVVNTQRARLGLSCEPHAPVASVQ